MTGSLSVGVPSIHGRFALSDRALVASQPVVQARLRLTYKLPCHTGLGRISNKLWASL